MKGLSALHIALPPWQSQQLQPSVTALQRVPSKQTRTFTSPLVELSHGHELTGKAGEGGEAGGGSRGGGAGDGGGDGGKSVQQPSHAVHEIATVICCASAHESDSKAEHCSVLVPLPHDAKHDAGGGGSEGGEGSAGGDGGGCIIRTYSR